MRNHRAVPKRKLQHQKKSKKRQILYWQFLWWGLGGSTRWWFAYEQERWWDFCLPFGKMSTGDPSGMSRLCRVSVRTHSGSNDRGGRLPIYGVLSSGCLVCQNAMLPEQPSSLPQEVQKAMPSSSAPNCFAGTKKSYAGEVSRCGASGTDRNTSLSSGRIHHRLQTDTGWKSRTREKGFGSRVPCTRDTHDRPVVGEPIRLVPSLTTGFVERSWASRSPPGC